MQSRTLPNLPSITIKLDGATNYKLEDGLQELLVESTYNMPSMAMLRIVVGEEDKDWLDNTEVAIGKPVEITLAAPGLYGGEEGLAFSGEIVAHEHEFSALGKHMLVIRAYDKMHRLHIGQHTRTFQRVTDWQVVQKLAREAGLSAKSSNPPTTQQVYLIQNNQTNLEFLSYRARRIGYHLYVQGQELHFEPHDLSRAKLVGPLILPQDIRHLRIRRSAAQQAQAYEVRGWDYFKKETVVGTNPAIGSVWTANGYSQNGYQAGGYGVAGKLYDTYLHPADASEAATIAKAMAVDQAGEFLEAEGIILGDPRIMAGVKVKLDKLSRNYEGDYFVTSAVHYISREGYETHFTLSGRYPNSVNHLLEERNGQSGAADGRIYGVVLGIVTNLADDDAQSGGVNLGRVKVKFPWMPLDNGKEIESAWCRIATPMAGVERGFYFLPEINDEVLVAFEHGDVARPYIVGFLWNGKDKPPRPNSEVVKAGKVQRRLLRTTSGHEVVLDDSAETPCITITDKTGKQIIKLDSKTNNIEIKADADLLVDVKGNIVMTAGQNIRMKANANIETNSQNLMVDAKTNINMKANAAVNVQSNGAMSTDAKGPYNLHGATVSVNGDANVAVKAALITLN
ncbi:MAG TPA: VgrG-related protein [Caldilineaceae bacterium]|nr:VgrG-related protein [Caldilineaceae bacterium]